MWHLVCKTDLELPNARLSLVCHDKKTKLLETWSEANLETIGARTHSTLAGLFTLPAALKGEIKRQCWD